MKILFLCGSLEPGRDGVGDYVRILGEHLSKEAGLTLAALSLYDPYVVNEKEDIFPDKFQTFRLPAKEKKRYQKASSWIQKFDPDWLSIQFVPYSFHKKGLPIFLARNLKLLIQDYKVHMMIHETWIGTQDFQIKSRLTAYLQKILLKRLLTSSSPKVIHTHLPEYSEKLKSLHEHVKELPLFSNIGVSSYPNKHNKKLVLGFFSQVECAEFVLSFLKEIGRKAMLAEIQIEVLLIGGQEYKMQKFSNFIQTLSFLKNKVRKTGFLANHEISHALNQCSLGITPLPRHALGKSGSVAAFLSHGIPVAAPHKCGRNPKEIGFFSKELQATIITEPELHKITRAKKLLNKVKEELSVPAIAQVFLKDLMSNQ